MIKRDLLLSIIAVTMSSLLLRCGNRDEANGAYLTIDSFPEVISLVGEPAKNIVFNSRGNVKMCVIDTFLVLQRKEAKFIHIYSTNSHQLLTEIGTKGRGLNEFIYPELLNQVGFDSLTNSPLIHLYDYTRRRFTRVNILKAIHEKEEAITQEPLPEIDSYFNYFFYKDNDFLISSTEKNSWPIIYDYKTTGIKEISLPLYDFSVDQNYLKYIYRPFVYVSKARKMMVLTPIFLGEMHYIDFEGKHVRTINFDPDYSDKITKSSKLSDFRFQINDIKSKSGLIYGLNRNKPANDEVSSSYKGIKEKIQVFDWNGKPVREYILEDERYIFSFAVDVMNNRIYGYCPDAEEHNLIIYKLTNGM
jgi:hypothetical protein